MNGERDPGVTLDAFGIRAKKENVFNGNSSMVRIISRSLRRGLGADGSRSTMESAEFRGEH
jgi:hypothetical protein